MAAAVGIVLISPIPFAPYAARRDAAVDRASRAGLADDDGLHGRHVRCVQEAELAEARGGNAVRRGGSPP